MATLANPTRIVLALLVLGMVVPTVRSQTAALIQPPGIYPQIRTWHEQALAVGPTRVQQLEHLRTIVKAGPHSGHRRLSNMFGNFNGNRSLDPGIPGVNETVRLTASSNRNVVTGASRTVVYATKIQHNPRYRLLALNAPYRAGQIRSDKDILFLDRTTGRTCWMEVKDLSPESQRMGRVKILKQIERMAVTARQSGELPVWVNRQEVLPQIKMYAEARGVQVYAGVSAGKRLGSTDVPFDRVLASVHQHSSARWRAAGASSVKLGGGAVLLASALPAAIGDLSTLDLHSQGSLLRVGEHAFLVVSGGGLAVSGAASMGSKFSQQAVASSKFAAVSKWGGRAGAVGFVVAEGFAIWQYAGGHITQREFAMSQATLGGGLLGGTAGALAGAKGGALTGGAIGSLFGPAGTVLGGTIGTIVGGITGGLGGGYAGSTLAAGSLSSKFRLQDKRQHEEYVDFLVTHYAK